MKLLTIAEKNEIELIPEEYKNIPVLITGIGMLNVIESLKYFPRETEIINIGYCGSNSLPIKTTVRVGKVQLYHQNVQYKEPIYEISKNPIVCYTSTDFVTSTTIKEPCVFDMELAGICSLGFKSIVSIKTVSDNLNYKTYKEQIGENYV